MKIEQPAGEPIVLTVNTIAAGQFIPAGAETPYTETSLPEHLKQYRATGDSPRPFTQAERDIYYGESRQGYRAARRLAATAAYEDMAIEALNKPLPPETAAALQDQHDKSIGLALAQAEANQRFRDAAYEQAARAAEPVQLYVKRGGEMGRVERSKLKPGEPVFVLRENGRYETMGVVDSRGELPPGELII
jgi:hypothetical protein